VTTTRGQASSTVLHGAACDEWRWLAVAMIY